VAKSDVLVLGAGMVGVSVAVHLARRGLATVLLDRRAPGEETSFGNAGLIEVSRMMPISFPRDAREVVRHALRLLPHVNFHWSALPSLTPFLLRYWMASRPDRLDASARALRPMLAASTEEHAALTAEAGAERLMRKAGLLKLYSSEESFAESATDRAFADEFGVPYQILDREAALAREPHLRPIFRNAVLWPETGNCSDPSALTKAYAALFERRGGVFVTGDARSLHRYQGGWRVETASGPVDAAQVVIALGPWGMELASRFGLKAPFAVKRGYHQHFAPAGNATLSGGVLDVDGGYCLLPMDRGIRLTTGVEFARREAPPTPIQIERTTPIARRLFPLGETLEEEPWMGARPALPDSLPIIGRAPKYKDLWLAFGHSHLGFTLGPPTGRLIAEMMMGETPFVDPAPYRPERFS
jgi:D-amino-acid dehydrogenase